MRSPCLRWPVGERGSLCIKGELEESKPDRSKSLAVVMD